MSAALNGLPSSLTRRPTTKQNKPHLTAIHRKDISLPTKYLQKRSLLIGRILDYGCGHGHDCDALGFEGYDPHWRPTPPNGKFDTIICNYVLNVLEESEWQGVLDSISGLLFEGGKAYITVRTDKDSLNGWTSKGTYQCEVKLDLPLVYNGKFRMYRLEKSCQVPKQNSMVAK